MYYVPSYTTTGSLSDCEASCLAVSLSSPVDPFPIHTYVSCGVTNTKQSLVLSDVAESGTCTALVASRVLKVPDFHPVLL